MKLILNHIKANIARNMNYMGIACGIPGSGKSYAAIKIAEEVAKIFKCKFDADKIAFSPEEFLEIIRDQNLKTGTPIVFEEVGVGLSARDWYSVSNKLINAVFQTFRRQKLVVLFNTPNMFYIDSNARVLFHGYIEPVNIDFRREVCTVKYFDMENNPRDHRRKIYWHHLENSGRKVKRHEIPKPSEEILDQYEEKKKRFASDLIESALKEMKNLRDKGKVVEGDKPNMMCTECGHLWKCKTKRKKVQCPSCFKWLENRNFKKICLST